MTENPPTDHAAEPLTELQLMLFESALAEAMADSLCLKCAHSTVLQLAFPPLPDAVEVLPSELVIYCGAMSRDITAPVKRCTSFSAKP